LAKTPIKCAPTKVQRTSHPRVLTIEYIPVASLLIDPTNPRLHTNKQIKQIAESIRAFGFNVPVLVDGTLRLIAGHGRLKASQLLGLSHLPAIRLEHLSENQQRALRIADNKLTENSEWNTNFLGEQLKILSEAELDFTLEAMGFEMAEIDLIVENLVPANETESDPADAVVELPSSPVSQLGDLWNLGKHRILCGNALSPDDYQQLMGDRKANLVFTDPPYNVPISGHVSGKGKIRHREFPMAAGELTEAEFTKFLTDLFVLLSDNSVNGSLHYICMDWRHIGEIVQAGRSAYSELRNICVWVKDNAGMGSFYRSQHELVLVFEHGTDSHRNNVQLGKFGRSRTNVWQYPAINSFASPPEEGYLLALHPTVKPVALVADAIMDCSMRGDLVLDPFSGSGTTLVAAERVGRTCYAMELDPAYVDTIVQRWQRFTGQEAILQATGQTYGQREKELKNGH
jgi:DNA modification methylase